MKQSLKIFLILLLFQMIVLPTISQIKYQTENDTLICYSKEDNRVIAVMLKEGELAAEMNILNDTLIYHLRTRINNYKDITNLMNTKIDVLEAYNKDLLYNGYTLQAEVERLTTVKKQWQTATFISGGSAIGLLLLLILL